MLKFFGSLIVDWRGTDAVCVPRQRPLVPNFDAEDFYYKEFTSEKKKFRRRTRAWTIPQRWDSDDEV